MVKKEKQRENGLHPAAGTRKLAVPISQPGKQSPNSSQPPEYLRDLALFTANDRTDIAFREV